MLAGPGLLSAGDTREAEGASERRALGIAFLLNGALSASLGVTGVLADSSSLLAAALDNSSDTGVYGLSYFAVGRGPGWKTRAAQFSALTLLALCALVLFDVIRRVMFGAEPVSAIIIVMTLVAATINFACLRLLRGHREDVNLRAAWTFSINDLVANLGTLVAGVLVFLFSTAWPDILVGLAIALVAAKGGIDILRDVGRGEPAESQERRPGP